MKKTELKFILVKEITINVHLDRFVLIISKISPQLTSFSSRKSVLARYCLTVQIGLSRYGCHF